MLDRGDTGAGPDWDALLAAADAGRGAAIAAGDTDALRTWVDPAGPAWPADSALAGRVSALHARVEGGSLVVLEVRPQAVAETRAVLLVRDRRSAYSVLTPDGTTTVGRTGAAVVEGHDGARPGHARRHLAAVRRRTGGRTGTVRIGGRAYGVSPCGGAGPR